MSTPVADYLASADQFERLVHAENRSEVRQLLIEQAQACYRLATKRSQPAPQNPCVPICTG